MKYYFLFLFIIIGKTFLFSQNDVKKIDSIIKENAKLKIEIKNLKGTVKKTESKLLNKINSFNDELTKQNNSLSVLLNEKESVLRKDVQSIYDSLQNNSKRVNSQELKLNREKEASEKNFLYSIIGILIVFVLVIVIYLISQRRAKSIEQKTGDLDASTADLKKQLSDLSTTTSEDLASALEKFANVASAQPTETEPDHTMVIEFAKQIVSMENNMSRMDPNDRGLKRIKRAIDKMHDTLKTMDYGITPLIGTNVFVGQQIDVEEQKIDENITPGNRQIYNVIKAEILFKGEQIQRGKVDIKYNPND